MSRSYKKPWIKDNPRIMKRIHARRYRRFIRQDLAQWRNRENNGIIRGCNTCDCMDSWMEFEPCEWRQNCLSFDLEPSYDPRNKWIDPYDICDWKIHCDRPEYRRK